MYIYATIDQSNYVTNYEIVETEQPETSNKKNIAITSEFDTSFYEGFDGFVVESVTAGNSTSYCLTRRNNLKIANKRQLSLDISGIQTDQGITEKMATAIHKLPWFIERTNIIESFGTL